MEDTESLEALNKAKEEKKASLQAAIAEAKEIQSRKQKEADEAVRTQNCEPS
jgi:hypothetical protein